MFNTRRLTVGLLLALPAVALAQPVLQGPSQLPPVGYTTPVSVGILPSPGLAGADRTWDFSTVALMTVGSQSVVDPATTPYASSYPTANFGFVTTSPQGSAYFYLRSSSDELLTLASAITGTTGQDQDYSPNPQRTLKFPFAFGESYTDTWQKVGGSPEPLGVSYDGYGTLVLPNGTYTNVVRTENRYNDVADYVWWTTSPLFPVMIWNHNNNMVTVFGATPASVADDAAAQARLAPNPARDVVRVSVATGGATARTLRLVDARGTIALERTLDDAETTVQLDGVARGVYVYEIADGRAVIATGALVVE